MNKYTNRIIAILVEKFGIDPEDVTADSYFEDDLNMDELELFELLAMLEEEFQVEFEDEEKEEISSIMDVVELIVDKVE